MIEKQFMLENRPDGDGPQFTESYQPDKSVEPFCIEIGDSVILKCHGITIIADVVEVSKNNYKGKIVGFENYFKAHLYGKSEEDIIDFNFANVFGCSR